MYTCLFVCMYVYREMLVHTEMIVCIQDGCINRDECVHTDMVVCTDNCVHTEMIVIYR